MGRGAPPGGIQASVYIVAALLCAPLPVVAQPSGIIEGRVVGPDRVPLGGVAVHLRDAANALIEPYAVTAASGAFRIEGLEAPATYRLVCSIGSLTELGPTVALHEGTAATADVALRLSLDEHVAVTADAWTVPVDVPNSAAIRTTDQLREQNLMNPEDALRYVPSTTIRKRYVGDRNALVGGRSFGTLQPSRGLVYLDGYLLSSFLGRFDAPRWNMVTPEALERVDVMYGPFSAVHAGNSIGTTVVMTERAPKHLEWSASVTGYGERLTQYGRHDDFDGGQLSVYAGTRFDSGLWSALTFNHQDATSHPMQYYTVSANGAGAFPAVTGAATPVTGIVYDTDPKGSERAVFGASAGAIDHTIQDSVKLRAGYTFARTIEANALVGGWINDTRNSDRTFLRDAAGQEIWQGQVTDGLHTFTVPATALAPSTHGETHRQLGLTLRTRRASGWNGSLIGSDYRILDDPTRQAANPDPVAVGGGPGTVTRRDGTGWNTLEAQATHAAEGHGRHALTFGAHRNAYVLDNTVQDALDWRSADGALTQRYRGKTEVLALYAQDAWKLRDDLKLTLGWREERYRTFAGEQLARVAACTASSSSTCAANGDGTSNKSVAYPERTLTGHSPKASLAWTASAHVLLRASFGRGVRFPNVEELYNGTVTAASVTLSDPDLKAERSNAFELTSETFFGRHALRTSLFHDDIRDSILRQSDITVIPTVTNVSNADRVKTSGVEAAWAAHDFGVRGLSLEANGAVTRSKVTANAKDPDSVGKYWLRVPKTRGSVLVAYRPTAKWMGSVGFRHQGRAYNDVYNLDVNPNVYGGVSSINQLDLRVSHKPRPWLEVASGADNVNDQHAYVSHPYPGRTLFLQVRTSSK
jgi:iron complex outermembrane receptor protein